MITYYKVEIQKLKADVELYKNTNSNESADKIKIEKKYQDEIRKLNEEINSLTEKLKFAENKLTSEESINKSYNNMEKK